MPADQREAHRIPIHWRTVVLFKDQPNIQARLVNISDNGLVLHAPQMLKLSQTYSLVIETLVHPDAVQHYYLRVQGSVMYSILDSQTNDFRVGFRFTQISNQDEQLLHNWIHRHLPGHFNPERNAS